MPFRPGPQFTWLMGATLVNSFGSIASPSEGIGRTQPPRVNWKTANEQGVSDCQQTDSSLLWIGPTIIVLLTPTVVASGLAFDFGRLPKLKRPIHLPRKDQCMHSRSKTGIIYALPEPRGLNAYTCDKGMEVSGDSLF